MSKGVLFVLICAVLNNASTQTIDYIMTTPTPATISTCNQWDELLPALKMIKSSPSIKKERLLNVVKIIKYLLADEMGKKQCDKILEDIKNADVNQFPEITDIDNIVDENLKPIKDALDGKTYITNNMEFQKDIPTNNTADFTKILAKISAALAKVKENNENAESQKPPAITPVCKSKKNECNAKLNQPLFETLGQGQLKQSQAGINSISSAPKFNIPCQRAADILQETSSFAIPKDAICNLPDNIDLNSILKNPKLNSENLPFKTVPNSISCVESDDSVAILFKPKKISLMQVYGNLLKKITITVLVPFHVSKMNL